MLTTDNLPHARPEIKQPDIPQVLAMPADKHGVQVKVICPYCNRQHLHGASSLRLSHCLDQQKVGQYLLVRPT